MCVCVCVCVSACVYAIEQCCELSWPTATDLGHQFFEQNAFRHPRITQHVSSGRYVLREPTDVPQPLSRVEIQTSAHRNLLGHSVTASPPVSSPSSNLPPFCSHCAFTVTRKFTALFALLISFTTASQ